MGQALHTVKKTLYVCVFVDEELELRQLFEFNYWLFAKPPH